MSGTDETASLRDSGLNLVMTTDGLGIENAGLVSRRAALGGLLAILWEARALAQTSPGGGGQTPSAVDALAAAGPPAPPDWPKVIKSGDATATFYLPQLDSWDGQDRKSTRLNSSHLGISYAVFCL